VRKTLLTLAALGLTAGIVLPTASSASTADDRHCYTLGAPGQPHYEYCTYLPVDPGQLIR
jgi:hypothetical protein